MSCCTMSRLCPGRMKLAFPGLIRGTIPVGPSQTRGLKDFSKKAVAPVLFVDGHVRYFNLAKHFQDNLEFPAELTSDRIWYRAKE